MVFHKGVWLSLERGESTSVGRWTCSAYSSWTGGKARVTCVSCELSSLPFRMHSPFLLHVFLLPTHLCAQTAPLWWRCSLHLAPPNKMVIPYWWLCYFFHLPQLQHGYSLVITVNLKSLKCFKKVYNDDIIGGLLALQKNNELENYTTEGWASPGMGWSSQWSKYIFLREYIELLERKGRWSAKF